MFPPQFLGTQYIMIVLENCYLDSDLYHGPYFISLHWTNLLWQCPKTQNPLIPLFFRHPVYNNTTPCFTRCCPFFQLTKTTLDSVRRLAKMEEPTKVYYPRGILFQLFHLLLQLLILCINRKNSLPVGVILQIRNMGNTELFWIWLVWI